MKIFIDSNEAKTSSVGAFYRNPYIDETGFWLPITVKEQLKSRWCWAAIASAVGNYYQTISLDQIEIAAILLHDFDNGEGLYSEDEIIARNVNFKLDVALKQVNCFSHWTIGKPIFERIQFEINQGRPLGVRLEWFKGGAHYILIKGYNDEGKILIEDSLHGPSSQNFNQFPDNYRESGAVWTETFWTNKLITNK